MAEAAPDAGAFPAAQLVPHLGLEPGHVLRGRVRGVCRLLVGVRALRMRMRRRGGGCSAHDGCWDVAAVCRWWSLPQRPRKVQLLRIVNRSHFVSVHWPTLEHPRSLHNVAVEPLQPSTLRSWGSGEQRIKIKRRT